MGELSRRRFLTGAAAGAALVAGGGFRTAARAAGRRPTVAVLGGGIAGLTAAHELAERGFQVDVYERRAWGGKARSMGVPGTGTDGRRDLPGEHGFRVFFGFERNLPDTMRRIPFAENREGVYGNLIDTAQTRISRVGKADLFLPVENLDLRGYLGGPIEETLLGLLLQLDLPPEAALRLAGRLAIFLTSSDERRLGQWDHVAWSDFIQAERYGGDYQAIFSECFTHLLQASRADDTSTTFVGKVLEWIVFNVLRRNANTGVFKAFDRPTNEAWIEPWLEVLRCHGVGLHLGHELRGLAVADDRVAGVQVHGPTGQAMVVADHYILALPVERARALLTPRLRELDPTLDGMDRLKTGWMSGIQYYLRELRPLSNGHQVYADSPWKTGSINQAHFWTPDFPSTYGDGSANDCLSVVISEWSDPGTFVRKAAKDCTPDEVAEEIWEQMKAHLNDRGHPVLRDADLLGWHLDPGLLARAAGGFDFEDPLVLPSVGAYQHRPASATAIENLALAGDYVRGEWEVANMEVANESGRRAAQAVLERSGRRAAPVEVFGTYDPPELQAAKAVDRQRFRSRLPHVLDHG